MYNNYLSVMKIVTVQGITVIYTDNNFNRREFIRLYYANIAKEDQYHYDTELI